MATDKEIDAVARAICDAEGFDWDAQADAMTSASGGDNEQDHYRMIATAALTAAEQARAREPGRSTLDRGGQKKREASKHDRRQAILDAQREAREADLRPSEEIVRELRGDWRGND